jgi:uncharacterized coiled-coil DUF342 family protein
LTGWQREALASETSEPHEAEPTSTAGAESGQQSLAALQEQADQLTAELNEIRQRVQELQNRQASTDEPAVEGPVS